MQSFGTPLGEKIFKSIKLKNMNQDTNSAILHISFDFPDIINSTKTKAVYNLVNEQKKYQNIVFSLNRTANPFANFSCLREQHGFTMNIFGLPYAIGLRLWMYFAYTKIYKEILKDNIQFNLIHAHKLTFEGLIANHISKKTSRPYIITVRGGTDLTLLKFLPFIRNLYLKILNNSRKVIYLAPWTKNEILKYFKKNKQIFSSEILPNIIRLNTSKYENNQEVSTNKFVTVFHLDSYKRKNIKRTILAINILHNKYPQIKLDIIGGGKASNKIQSYINKCSYPSQFKLVGEMNHKDVLDNYYKYLGFILPSFPETFGMVFIEALHAGIPIVFSKNSGIDGYFDDVHIGERVRYNSIQDISSAILKIYKENSNYRDNIRHLKDNGKFLKFTEKNIIEKYLRILERIEKVGIV